MTPHDHPARSPAVSCQAQPSNSLPVPAHMAPMAQSAVVRAAVVWVAVVWVVSIDLQRRIGSGMTAGVLT
ncbi:hypothetical protein ACIBHX_04645 [Nonomuraea sp. NPDC050536]|uniref:hypothetical protein n=1 Tax=Nonomuraea sp. NPDC050536 TaxID=3364366 RepID=UPI0037CAC116